MSIAGILSGFSETFSVTWLLDMAEREVLSRIESRSASVLTFVVGRDTFDFVYIDSSSSIFSSWSSKSDSYSGF